MTSTNASHDASPPLNKEGQMKKSIYEKLSALCETQGVTELNIGGWDGGEDSGSEDLDEELLRPVLTGEEYDWLAQNVSDSLGYGSYAGEYETSGVFLFQKLRRAVVADGSWTSHVDTVDEETYEQPIPVSELLASRVIDIVLPDRIGTDEDRSALSQILNDDDSIRPEFCDLVLKNGVTPDDYQTVVDAMRLFVSDVISQSRQTGHDFVEITSRSPGDLQEGFLHMRGAGQVYESESEWHELDLNWDENWTEPEEEVTNE